jgi:hypothetical protein
MVEVDQQKSLNRTILDRVTKLENNSKEGSDPFTDKTSGGNASSARMENQWTAEKTPELQLFRDEQKIDVCLLAEMHFTKQSYIKMKGYQVYHKVHHLNTAPRGRAVLVKDNMMHHEEANYVTDEIQAIVITVKTRRQATTFAAAYCPSRYNLKKTTT